MDDKLDDAQLGVDYLCTTMAMSRSTLNRKLKSLLDVSPNDLIRQYRLQKASSLLSTGMDISTVAYQVGFSSPSYFSQCFKEQYGLTPSEHISKQNWLKTDSFWTNPDSPLDSKRGSFML